MKRILAATDLYDDDGAVLRYARLFADRLGASLTVMYADPILYPGDAGSGLAVASLMSTLEHESKLKEELGRYAGRWLKGIPHELIVTVGPAGPMIVKTAEKWHADLIVIGSHHRPAWERVLFGSPSAGVLHASHCPVLAVRATSAPLITKIVCPVNFTEVAHDAAIAAAQLAEAFSAELVLVHVNEEGPAAGGADEQTLRRWIASHVPTAAGHRDLVLRGGAPERVLDCVEDLRANLLVIGAQRKAFRNTTVIGTTTERIVRFADCPVFIVTREPAARPQSERSHTLEEVLV